MKRRSAVAHFRQLCCLGLPPQAVIPSLLLTVHEIVPSEANCYHFADASGRMAAFVPEYVIPEVVTALVENFDDLIERAYQINFPTTMLRGMPVGNLMSSYTAAFYRSEVHHLVFRPYNLHQVIDVVVRDTPDGQGIGAFLVGRSKRHPDFSASEKGMLLHLMPYIAHAMHGGEERASVGREDEFADSGSSGLVVLDARGQLVYSSQRARQVLYYAANPGTPAVSPRIPASAATPASLRVVFDNLVRIAQQRAAPPPVLHHRNRWGRFVFRAHWLEPSSAGQSALIGVTVQLQEPLADVMMRRMREAGLSQRQEQVCLLLAQHSSFESIAKRLQVSHATAKDYADRIYRKLDVHTRGELLQKLH